MKVLRILLGGFAVAAVALWVGCGGGGGGAPAGGGNPPANTFSVDVADSADSRMILVANAADGSSVTYFGAKDAEGTPTSIDSVVVKNASGASTEIMLDENGRPVGLIGDDGTTFALDWLSATEVAVTATTPDGAMSVTTVVDPNTGQEPADKSRASFGDGDRQLGIPEATLVPRAASRATQKTRVRVLKGGNPFDPTLPSSIKVPTVFLALASADADYNDRYTAYRVGTGIYEAAVPVDTPSLPTVALRKVLANFSDIHGLTCTFVTNYPHMGIGICTSLSTVALLVPVIDAGTPAIFGACSGAWAAYLPVLRGIQERRRARKPAGLGGLPLHDRLEKLLKPPTQSPGNRVQIRAFVRTWEFGVLKSLPGNLVTADIENNGQINIGPNELRVNLEADSIGPPGSGSDDDQAGSEASPPAKPAIALSTSPAVPRKGSTYSVNATFTGVPQGGRVYLSHRKRNGGEVQTAGANWAQIGADGQHSLKITRTLGESNAHWALARIFDSGNKIVAQQTRNY